MVCKNINTMKHSLFILSLSLLLSCIDVKAEDVFVPPPKKKEIPKDPGTQYRAPAILPVEIVYNTETAVLRITSWGETEAEVFILDANGEVENYSPTLACELTVPSSGVHTIYIQGEGWDASTEFVN